MRGKRGTVERNSIIAGKISTIDILSMFIISRPDKTQLSEKNLFTDDKGMLRLFKQLIIFTRC